MLKDQLGTSAKMAITLGILLPLLETIRRANQLLELENFFKWFDDYMLGFVLFIAALRVLKEKKNSIAYLVAAWGIAIGGLFLSFLSQFESYKMAAGDPGLFSTTLVVIVKGTMLLYAFVGLTLCINANETQR